MNEDDFIRVHLTLITCSSWDNVESSFPIEVLFLELLLGIFFPLIESRLAADVLEPFSDEHQASKNRVQKPLGHAKELTFEFKFVL